MRRVMVCVAGAVVLAGLTGCAMFREERWTTAGCAKFFDSPRQAVEVIGRLLKEEDFETLARYYDLSATPVRRSDLETGEYFIRKKRPASAHPAGFWRYKHPFPPGFKYVGHEMSDEADRSIYEVEVAIAIDQGAGQPAQRAIQRFLMRRSTRGWQVLPGRPK